MPKLSRFVTLLPFLGLACVGDDPAASGPPPSSSSSGAVDDDDPRDPDASVNPDPDGGPDVLPDASEPAVDAGPQGPVSVVVPDMDPPIDVGYVAFFQPGSATPVTKNLHEDQTITGSVAEGGTILIAYRNRNGGSVLEVQDVHPGDVVNVYDPSTAVRAPGASTSVSVSAAAFPGATIYDFSSCNGRQSVGALSMNLTVAAACNDGGTIRLLASAFSPTLPNGPAALSYILANVTDTTVTMPAWNEATTTATWTLSSALSADKFVHHARVGALASGRPGSFELLDWRGDPPATLSYFRPSAAFADAEIREVGITYNLGNGSGSSLKIERTAAAGDPIAGDADLPAHWVSATMREPFGRPMFDSTFTRDLPAGVAKFGRAFTQTDLAGRVDWVTVRTNPGPTLFGPALPQVIVDEVVGADADWVHEGQAYAAFTTGAESSLFRQHPLETLGALRSLSAPPTVTGAFTAVYGETR